MKLTAKIIFILIMAIIPFASINTYAADVDIDTANLKTWAASSSNWVINGNNALNNLKNADTDFTVDTSVSGQTAIFNSIIRIARDLKNLFFLIAWVYFLVIVIRLLFSEKTEEEAANFKKWIMWISIWIIVTQISYYMVNVLFDKEINVALAKNFVDIVIQPLISLLQTSASFIFIWMMIFAFFKLVTANWNEDQIKSWKMTVLYSIIWFILIKAANTLVDSVYSKISCSSIWWVNCTSNIEISWASKLITDIINWMNWFVWLVVIIMIIYAWLMVLTSVWDEEKLKKAKSIILYIAIWLFILVANYLILTFFISANI